MYRYIYCGVTTGNSRLNHHSGTDKSVPYKVRPKTKHCTTGSRCSYGLFQCSEPGHRKNRIRRCSNAPLKKREATTVFSAIPNRATRDNRIRRCANSPLKNQQGNVDCLFFCVENLGSKFCVLKVSNLRTFFSTRKNEAYQASFRLFHNNFNYC